MVDHFDAELFFLMRLDHDFTAYSTAQDAAEDEATPCKQSEHLAMMLKGTFAAALEGVSKKPTDTEAPQFPPPVPPTWQIPALTTTQPSQQVRDSSSAHFGRC